MKYYTGIGSRETPLSVLELMTKVANELSMLGYTLRSGRAGGADTAFEMGADEADLFIPWKGFSDKNELNGNHNVYVKGDDSSSRDIARTLHPVWRNLSRGAKALHTRNVNQIVGESASKPELSDFVLFYAPLTRTGRVKGGTATAVNYARDLGIPTLNLIDVGSVEEVFSWINQQG